jgi:hypothetical protein
MGLGNTIATIANTPQYSNMANGRPFLQFSGTWPHPEKPERMHLMVFGNPELIPFLKNPGQFLFYFLTYIFRSNFMSFFCSIFGHNISFLRVGFVRGCNVLMCTAPFLPVSHHHDI